MEREAAHSYLNLRGRGNHGISIYRGGARRGDRGILVIFCDSAVMAVMGNDNASSGGTMCPPKELIPLSLSLRYTAANRPLCSNGLLRV